MKFLNMAPGQKLILIKTNIPTLPPCPVIARSVKPATPGLIRLVLWLASCLAPIIAHWPPGFWTNHKARFAILVIVGIVAVEVLAQNHIERALGVMA